MGGIDVRRLRLAEDLQRFYLIAHGHFFPSGPLSALSPPDPEHPAGWQFLRSAGDQLRPLGSPHADRFAALLKKRGPASELRDEGMQILRDGFEEVAATVYTLPARPEALLDRIDAIMTDANEVAALIVGCANGSQKLRYLLERLRDELRGALGNGRSTLSPGAKVAVGEVFERLDTMSMNFNAMEFAEDPSEPWGKAYACYGELPVLVEKAGEAFRLMRDEEAERGRPSQPVTQIFHGDVKVKGNLAGSMNGGGGGDNGGRDKPKGWNPTIIVAIITGIFAVVAAVISGWFGYLKDAPKQSPTPAVVASPSPSPSAAPTAVPSPTAVPFECKQSDQCPAGFAYIGRLYGESNQGTPAFNARRDVLLPPHFRLDTSYQQSEVNCCGGGARAQLSPADIPRGILIKPDGTVHWSTSEPRLETGGEQMKFSMALYCGPEAWPGRGCNVHVDVCAKCAR